MERCKPWRRYGGAAKPLRYLTAWELTLVILGQTRFNYYVVQRNTRVYLNNTQVYPHNTRVFIQVCLYTRCVHPCLRPWIVVKCVGLGEKQW